MISYISYFCKQCALLCHRSSSRNGRRLGSWVLSLLDAGSWVESILVMGALLEFLIFLNSFFSAVKCWPQPFPSYKHFERYHFCFQKMQIVLQFHMRSIGFHIPIYFIICKMRAQPFPCTPCSLDCSMSCIFPSLRPHVFFSLRSIFLFPSEHRNQNMQFFLLVFPILAKYKKCMQINLNYWYSTTRYLHASLRLQVMLMLEFNFMELYVKPENNATRKICSKTETLPRKVIWQRNVSSGPWLVPCNMR